MTDRLICKHCGNTDSNKMDFTSDGRYIYCHVCSRTTPLYSEFKVVELEGVQTLQTRLQSGETLLSLGKYQDAETVFRDLTKDYAGDYRTWFGLFRAKSKDFSTSTFDWEVMKNALAVARKDPGAMQLLNQVSEHCRAMESLNQRIQEKQRGIEAGNRSLGQLNRSLTDEKEPALALDTSFESQIAELEEQNKKAEETKKKLGFRRVPVTAGLAFLSILWYGYQNTVYYTLERTSFIQSLLMLVYFLLMFGLCGAAVAFTLMYLTSTSRRLQLRKEIAKRKQSIQELRDRAAKAELTAKQNHEEAMTHFRQSRIETQDRIRQIQAGAEASVQEIQLLKQECSRHVEALHGLRSPASMPA